jgi:putative PIN family toxin of toxin-antitoxin system
MIRVILDTNVWLDWLVFADPSVAAIRAAHAAGSIEICITTQGEAELERVLGYERGRRTLAAETQAACLAQCRTIARRIDARAAEAGSAKLPACRDRDDQQFLEAALAAGADYLITKDKALLELAKARARMPAPFRIVTPQGFAQTPTTPPPSGAPLLFKEGKSGSGDG